MLSQKAKYALRALVLLAEEPSGGPLLISEIAARGPMPKKFLEQILLSLKNKGILQSRKGRGGGYALGRGPENISLGEVIRLLDGPLAPLPCVSVTAYRPCEDCEDERTCGLRLVMMSVREETARILDGTSLADVLGASRRAKRRRSRR
jgi:Rrf2 family protein